MKLKTFSPPALTQEGFEFQEHSGGDFLELNDLISELPLKREEALSPLSGLGLTALVLGAARPKRAPLSPSPAPVAPPLQPEPPHPEVRRLQARVSQLEDLVHRLLKRIEQGPTLSLPAPTPAGTTAVPGKPQCVVDPYKAWLAQHRDVLARYPNCFVAIDPSKGPEGIVLHSADEEEFSLALLEFYDRDPDARGQLLPLHTSLYV